MQFRVVRLYDSAFVTSPSSHEGQKSLSPFVRLRSAAKCVQRAACSVRHAASVALLRLLKRLKVYQKF
jgi:hypothetical protein